MVGEDGEGAWSLNITRRVRPSGIASPFLSGAGLTISSIVLRKFGFFLVELRNRSEKFHIFLVRPSEFSNNILQARES